jgi:RNA polymerase sigma-70 factor (ECF subfamily)
MFFGVQPTSDIGKGIMSQVSSHEITQLLIAWENGEQAALDKLVPLIHAELYRLAKAYMGRERPDHPLQPTALVNEAYIRLIDWKSVGWKNRAHFFGVSAQLMRHILVDFARQRRRNAGEALQYLPLNEELVIGNQKSAEIVALDEALKELEKLDPRKSRIVELRYFGGLSVEETAEVIKVSAVMVMREWNKARMWLYKELHG